MLTDGTEHDQHQQQDGEGRGDGRVDLSQRDEGADAHERPYNGGAP
jgi:hypothetical protein